MVAAQNMHYHPYVIYHVEADHTDGKRMTFFYDIITLIYTNNTDQYDMIRL